MLSLCVSATRRSGRAAHSRHATRPLSFAANPSPALRREGFSVSAARYGGRDAHARPGVRTRCASSLERPDTPSRRATPTERSRRRRTSIGKFLANSAVMVRTRSRTGISVGDTTKTQRHARRRATHDTREVGRRDTHGGAQRTTRVRLIVAALTARTVPKVPKGAKRIASSLTAERDAAPRSTSAALDCAHTQLQRPLRNKRDNSKHAPSLLLLLLSSSASFPVLLLHPPPPPPRSSASPLLRFSASPLLPSPSSSLTGPRRGR